MVLVVFQVKSNSDNNNWNERYGTGDLPWDTGRSDFNLREIVDKRGVTPCKALEVGCGTGSNAIWLAEQGFSVTAVDIAEKAIERAKENAARAGVRCDFFAADFMIEKINAGPFGFIFDRGCFHSFELAEERTRYADKAHSYLSEDGLWLSLVGSTDEPPRDPGPPRLSALNIVTAVEPYFQILSLYASHFDSTMEKAPMAWVCLMRRR